MQCRVASTRTKIRSVQVSLLALALVLSLELGKRPKIDVRASLVPLVEQIYPGENTVQHANSTCTAKGIHLALHSDVNDDESVSMTVSFFLPLRPCKYARPIVSYGKKFQEDSPTLAQVPEALQLEYASRNTGNKTFLSPWVYHVELSELEAGEHEYWYRIDIEVADELCLQPLKTSNITLGEAYYFRTPPLPGSPTSIAIVADLGDTVISHRTIRGIQRNSVATTNNQYPASLAIVAGDIVYADGEPYFYPRWFTHTESLFRHLPLSVAVGNHEVECDIRTLEVFGNHELWFRNPNRRADEREAITPEYKKSLRKEHCISPTRFQAKYNYGNSFYAYRHGSVHVIVLNPYTSCSPGSVQYSWLHAELRDKVDRSRTPWVMVVTHNPLYTTFDSHIRPVDGDDMETLFNAYGVNLVMSGHDHGYMRSKPISDAGTVARSGAAPIYFIVGTGGSAEGPPIYGYKSPYLKERYVAARSHRVTGFGQLTVYNATDALWEFHANEEEAGEWYLRHVVHNHKTSENMTAYKDTVMLRNHFVS